MAYMSVVLDRVSVDNRVLTINIGSQSVLIYFYPMVVTIYMYLMSY